ncbi:MAG: STAS domain-containing protein [Desulfovibrionaceae bacterium]
MEFKSEKNGGFVVVAPSGRMDALSAPEFEKHCMQWLEQGESRIVADMAGLDYISSAGLRSILSTAKKLKQAGGEIRFCGLSGMVGDVFRISGFESMFKTFATADEAVAG